MHTKNFRPTADQTRWWGELVEMGCIYTGKPAEVDHLVGAAAKHNKIHVGQWWVVALSPDLHRTGAVNRTTRQTMFENRFSSQAAKWGPDFAFEKELWFNQCCRYMEYFRQPLPFEADVMYAIMGYRK